jgi:hypothetical protein
MLRAFEDDLLTLTQAILRVGVLDIDHALYNLVVSPDGTLMRLDLELARRVWFPSLATKLYGTMLGRLVASYAYAVQPRVELVSAFAGRLVQRLVPRQAALRQARMVLEQALARQLRLTGIDTRVALPW